MPKVVNILKRTMLGALVAMQLFFYPAGALAETSPDQSAADPADSTSQSTESTTAEEPTSEPTVQSESTTGPTEPTGPQDPVGPQTTTGPTQPTGSDSSTFTYNEATGLWENDYYTWDPVTHQTKPKQQQTYSYNPTTGHWDTTEWYYSPEQGKYVANTVSTANNPSAQGGTGSIYGTGPQSNNTIDFGGQTNGTFDLFFDSTISNRIGQMSQSGNAMVDSNLQAGSATSGDAQTLLNLLNMIQSSWGDLGQDIATFSADINGDIVGDLYVDPSQIFANSSGNSNIDVNVSTDAAIQNDIDVSAQSGNATVTNNTHAGDATSGDARALVNLINMINSAIYANKSFVGVLNINGNLDGDILLPPNLLQAIIASTGPQSNNTIGSNNNSNLDVDVTTNSTINNDIDASAVTGDAVVANNTIAGDATTGSAQNNVVLLNLTGHQVVANNALLVFVNVLGSWVGLIMDAPAGTYAVAATGPQSNNTITANGNHNTDVDVTENSLIDNNVHATAQSGDATVMNNTTAGDATTGDADVSVNVLNMIDSNFRLSDWFGVLFINVFGSWNGSFGVNTAAGNRPAGGMGGGQTEAATTTDSSPSSGPGQVFGFIPKAGSSAGTAADGSTTAAASDTGGQTSSSQTVAKPAETAASTTAKKGLSPLVPIVAFALGVILLGADRIFGLVKRS